MTERETRERPRIQPRKLTEHDVRRLLVEGRKLYQKELASLRACKKIDPELLAMRLR